MMKRYGETVFAVVIFLVSYQVDATIITLDDNNIRETGVYVEGNFRITAPAQQVNGTLDLSISPHLRDIGFSGRYMETWNTEAVFSLEEVTGKAFDLVSLDVGSYFGESSSHLGLAAWAFSGFNGSVQIFSSVEPEYSGKLILDWANLTRVTIQSSRASAASAFDNIEVLTTLPVMTPTSAANPVDAPQSTLLMAAVVFFARLIRRKFNTRVANVNCIG